MNKTIQIIIFLLSFSFNSFSQDSSAHVRIVQSIYVEAGGIGGFYSLNYEIRFPYIALRIGGETMNYDGESYTQTTTSRLFMLPVELLLVPPHKANSCPEVGFAVIPVLGKRDYIQIYNPISSQQSSSNYAEYYAFQIGYRYQPINKHLIFRADFTFLEIYNPSIFSSSVDGGEATFVLWGGISLGYSL